MASIPSHPNDAGTWTRLEGRDGFALWRRERQALAPVTMYYVVAPPRQSEILYDEAKARARFIELADVSGMDPVIPDRGGRVRGARLVATAEHVVSDACKAGNRERRNPSKGAAPSED